MSMVYDREEPLELDYVFEQMEHLTMEHYKGTYFTVAELRPEDPRSDQVREVVLPVDQYEYNGIGFEIMPVRILAAHCPWDMTKTIVRVDTNNTHILENLHNIVVEDAELHRHLVELDK